MMRLLCYKLAELLRSYRYRSLSCAWVEERLAAYSDWDLPIQEYEAVEAHLRCCPACRRSLADTEAIIGSLRDGLASSDPAAHFPRRSAVATMAYIRAAEGPEAAPAPSARRGPTLTAGWAAAACLVVLLMAAVAALVHRDSPDAMAGPVASALPAGPATVTSQATDATLADLGVVKQLGEEFSEALASLRIRAMIPATEAELEAWARREYPADMWFYDLLCQQHDYRGGWQLLLRESGECLRFDYPTHPGDPNCRPSLCALQRMARVAGLDLTLAPAGDILLPRQPWREGVPSCQRARLEKVPAPSQPSVPPPVAPPPPAYSQRIVADSGLASSAIAYLLIAGHIAGEPLDQMSPEWEALLLLGGAEPATGGAACSRETIAAQRLESLLQKRRQLIGSVAAQKLAP